MKSTIQDKTKLVNSVFSKVYKNYDLMNDIMSLGVHRIWKNKFIEWMNPIQNSTLIDVASGTGDIAKLFSRKTKNLSEITCVEPNNKMFLEGKENLKNLSNINWIKSNAESLPVKNNFYDFYSISYGIRNVTDINKSLKEAYRVLKFGGILITLVPDWESNYKIYFDDFTHRTPFTNIGLEDAYKMYGFSKVNVFKFRQLPLVWKYPKLNYFCAAISPFIPVRTKNKVFRWSRELMLVGSGVKK